MKKLVILHLGIIAVILNNCSSLAADSVAADNGGLPSVLPTNHTDLVASRLRMEAAIRFGVNQLPVTLKDWEAYRTQLKERIILKTGALVNQTLSLDVTESGTIKMEGYIIKNISFQTRPGVFCTANLYVPDGKGPFPAVIVMSGHSKTGRIWYQSLGYTLALNGYVSLTMDPWGAGERTTNHGTFEYHGANLGASLMNIGESLMGLQITDNMRGVDLLCSLPYVDPTKIGATGASGGGNQTMWLTAMDERIKASVPVVSVGTFESYVMGHNCVCEVLIDGLTFTEEAGVLALVAPRALMLSNGLKDSNPAFYPSEMLRSFNNAMPIFEMYGAGKKFSHFVFDGPHSYPPETRVAMIDLFNVNLKGLSAGAGKKEAPVSNDQPQEKIMVYPAGQRDTRIISTADFCRKRGNELRLAYLAAKSFDKDKKQKELKEILRINDESVLKKINRYSSINEWEKFTLETSDGKLIPLLLRKPREGIFAYTIISSPDGAKGVLLSNIDEMKAKGTGIVIVDLSGTGEASSDLSKSNDTLAKLHTLSRSELWLGKTVIGEWVKELGVVTQFLCSEYKTKKINIDGTRESGIAGLFLATLGGKIDNVVLRNAPISYLFDVRETVDFFSMGIHIPGILKWGDVSLAAALSGKDLTFINPVTMSGQSICGEKLGEYRVEFDKVRKTCRQKGRTSFN